MLLVSDQLVRSVIQEILESAGYTVLPTGDLGTAVDRLKTCKAHLLITRSYVASMLGHDAAKYLCARCPNMRVLMVGGLIDDDRLRHREALAGFEVFPQPYAAAQLLEKVRAVLSAHPGIGHDRAPSASATP